MRAFLTALLVLTTFSAAWADDPAPAGVDFDRDVRPILSDHCFACHGPDEKERKSKLRLDTKEGLFSTPDEKPVVTAGDSAQSELFARITHADPEERMPPAKFAKQLTPEQIDILKRWIDGGAKYQTHWSFLAVERPQPPAVNNVAWVRGPIDAFVLAKLEEKGLAPNAEADRYTLIRRVSLDLTGLPPSVQEVDAFVSDASPDAYEKMVDRILASPHYGEKMAQMWLDLARFGDTNGYHYDSTRQMWLWRNYVIDSFNNNKPFDQFSIEQLAGDLIPEATNEQKIASGFNRNTRFNEEGGADPEEFRVSYAVDRANTLGTVWMGLTVECAQCHSHKYDPISHKEYYQLFAFFNSLEEPQTSGNHNQTLPPLLKVMTPEQEKALADARAQGAELDAQLNVEVAKVNYLDPGSNATQEQKLLPSPTEFVWVDDEVPAGAIALGNAGAGDWVFVEAPAPVSSGQKSMKRSGPGLHQHFFTQAGQKLRVGAQNDKLFAYVYLDPEDPPKSIMLQYNDGADGADNWAHRAYWGEDLIEYGRGSSGPDHYHMGPLPAPGQWVRLEVDAAAVGLQPGAIVHGMAWTNFDGTAYYDRSGIVTQTQQTPPNYVWVDDALPAGAQPADLTFVAAPEQVHGGEKSIKRIGLGFHQSYFTNAGRPITVRAGEKLFAHVYLDPQNPPRQVMLQFFSGDWNHRAFWGEDLIEAGATGTPGRLKLGELPETGKWIRLEVDPAQVGLAPGAAITGFAFSQFDGAAWWDTAGVTTYYPPSDRHLESLSAWEQLVKGGGEPSTPQEIKNLLNQPVRDEKQINAIRDYYIRNVWAGAPATLASLKQKHEETLALAKKLDEEAPTTMISQEMAERRKAFILIRGNFSMLGEEVERATPAVLPPMAPDLPKNRLGLAKWLVDRQNPLTARVMVNRLWKQIFGTGLVNTMGDFGSQGERPSHPDLLDWLAAEFMEPASGSGTWDVKGLIRQMLLSSTYRQAAKQNPEYAEVDNGNRLLWCSPRYRLSAEEVRDNALAISGLLVPQIGGPSVKPYQPENYYVGKYDAWQWEKSSGQDLYRRGMYTFWRRTSLYPTFSMFDAPSREVCTADRARTNTPLQALAMLNDPVFVEAARVFAQRILTEGGQTPDERLSFAFRSAVARPATEVELSILKDTLQEQQALYTADPAAANELVNNAGPAPRPPEMNISELAAWTAVANVILNLDETITRE